MSDPAEVITVTLGDKTFRAGRRTAAHIEYTIEQLALLNPDAHLHITQPCYNNGVGASEGTHDLDGCIDVDIFGLTGPDTQTFMRKQGWAAWFRTPAQGFPFHNHAISLGCPGPVGLFVDGGISTVGHRVASSQLEDYRLHAFGLEGMHEPGSDTSWFPPDIDATIFDFQAWEERMTPEDFDKVRAIVREEIAAVPAATAKAVWMWDGFNNVKDKAKALLLRASK